MSSYLYEARYGLAVAFALLVWITLEYQVGLHTTHIASHSIVTNFFAIIPIYLMWRALKHRRDVLEGGQVLWWQGVTSGMVISVVAGALAAPTMWFFTKFINPGFYQAMIDFAVASGEKREIAEANFHPTVYAIQSTLSPVIMGFLTSVILTAIARFQVERRTKAAANPS